MLFPRHSGLLALLLLALSAVPVQAQFPLELFGGRKSNRNIEQSREQTQRDTIRNNASLAYQANDYAKVLEITNGLLAADPNDAVALHLRASAQIEIGRETGSVEKIRAGIEDARASLAIGGQKYPWLYTPYFYGLSSLANLESRPEHADLAIKIATALLARTDLKPFDRGPILYQRGLCYLSKQDSALALEDFSEAVKSNPELLAAHFNRAELLFEAQKFKDAEAAYDQIVNNFPNKAIAFNYRGKFRRARGNLDGAMSDFSQALKLEESAYDYVNRGMCLLDTNDPLAAEGDFTQAVKLDPKFVMAYRLRSTARIADGDAAGAVKDCDTALQLAPEELGIYEERGFSRYFAKDFAGAAADFEHAFSQDPQAFRLAPWLYLSLVRAGKPQDAAQALDSKFKDKVPQNTWQAALCGYLRGRQTEQQLLQATKSPDAEYQRSRECEAHYFIGESQSIRGAAEAAKSHFLEVEKTGRFSFAAYRGAKYELGRFKK